MRRRILTVVILCLTTALAGCTPGDEPSTPASWSPVPPLFTPEPSPSPSWNDDEQAAINAVQNYLDVRGCYIIENSHIVDQAGEPIKDDTRVERNFGSFIVLRTLQNDLLVMSSVIREGTC
ncbi:MAG: hypothetical protein LBV06_11110 [Propionibacteriaceae bacterium]|nr:hypothetical protein [Propionibacteriaceae bacterium]